jgi:predicted dienelactone hydrolase
VTTSAGFRRVAVVDEAERVTFPLLVLHPSPAPEHALRIGPYTLDVASDAPVGDGVFPLVVMSHGTGGSPLTFRTMAAHLARRGFVVALPEHAGNSRTDDTLAHTDANLARRPRHVRLAIDRLYADPTLGPRLVPDMVAVVGHSMGGYTALAVAGGRPTAFAHESPDGRAHPVPVTPDPRVRALVLLAPATPWFLSPGALAEVRAPILMLTAEHDPHTPEGHAEIVRRGLPRHVRVEHRVIAGAGHFSFQSPFPPAMAVPGFLPAQDPPGFDRAGFQATLHADVEEFLREALR